MILLGFLFTPPRTGTEDLMTQYLSYKVKYGKKEKNTNLDSLKN